MYIYIYRFWFKGMIRYTKDAETPTLSLVNRKSDVFFHSVNNAIGDIEQ
jgi:hypothetical protein